MLQEIQSKLIQDKVVPDSSFVAIGDVPSQTGFPYIVIRPIYAGSDERALCGQSVVWSQNIGVYCVAQAPDASMYVAHGVLNSLDGEQIDGASLRAEAGYTGSSVNGVFESLVTVSYEKGALDAYI